jgi:hypothetical protein
MQSHTHRPSIKRQYQSDSKPHPNDSVYQRITAIIGVYPNQTELIAIVRALDLIPLTRSEKRVKALLIQKIEDERSRILPFLETPQGIGALQRAYLKILTGTDFSQNQNAKEQRKTSTDLPPEATVSFYLNRPREHF